MFDIFPALCGSLFVLALVAWALGVPIYVLVRMQQVTALRERLRRVEHELALLQRGQLPEAVESVPVLELAVTTERREQPRRRPRPEPSPSPWAGIDVEAWIGKRGLGWVAVVLLLFATAFFVKQAFDSNLIGNLGRVALGVLAGTGLCVAGYSCHQRRYRVFSQMLTSAGIVLLYLTTFASFGYYSLMPQRHAGVFFVLIVVQAVALAWLYDAPAIAIMATIGGLLTPLLLYTGRDQYQTLLTYLAVLNAAAVALVWLRRWHALGSVALLGTQLLFWIWHQENYHPEKLGAALLFQAVVFALYLGPTLLGQVVQRHRAGVEDLGRLLVNALLFSLIAYVLLDEQYHPWMGTFMLAMAIVYALLAWLLSTRFPEDQRQLLVVVAASLGLLAMVFPIQAKAAWIGVGWAAQGALLWWFGMRIRTLALRLFGAVLLVAAVCRLVVIDTVGAHAGPFVPLFNQYGLPATFIALCVLFVAAMSRLAQTRGLTLDQAAMWLAGVGGVLLLWFIVSFETYDFFIAQIDRRVAVRGAMVDARGRDVSDVLWEENMRLKNYAWMFLSVVWAVYAASILGIGFWRENRPLRWTALGIFGATLLKVVFSDMGMLGGYYRVGAFFFLAVMLGLAAWLYQRFQVNRSPEREEVTA